MLYWKYISSVSQFKNNLSGEYIVVMHCILFSFWNQNHCLFLATIRFHLFSFVVLLVVIRCRSLSLVVSITITHCHLLSLVVTRCYSLCYSLSLTVNRCTTRCHSLSLDAPLVCLFITGRFYKTDCENSNSQFCNTMCSNLFSLFQSARVTAKLKTLTDNIFFQQLLIHFNIW